MQSSFTNPSDEKLREILSRKLTVAVVGCSPREERASYRIARVLIQRGHEVIPVNPNAESILEKRCYPSLFDIPSGIQVDMVDLFRRPRFVGKHVDEAIEIGAEIVWMQLDVIDETAAQKAQEAGLTVVMDRCPAIEYRRLFPNERPR